MKIFGLPNKREPHMDTLPFANNRCYISDDWIYKGMRVIYMENDFIRIGILADRGSDIFEFYFKPRMLDFMLRTKKGIINPATHFSQMRNTSNQFEDYYYGGWQEILPNSPAFSYRGASLGQHGEISLIPWKYSIVENTEEKVAVKLWVRPLRLPILIEKTYSITSDGAKLQIEEKLVNESGTALDIMWGHHIAFGLPFLNKGGRVFTNASEFIAEPQMPDQRLFKPGIISNWPIIEGIDGNPVDASIIPEAEKDPYSELAYLSGFPSQAHYAIWNVHEKIGFAVRWDPSVFSHLWYWQERFSTKDAPWWGDVYAVALEPWSSKWTNEPELAIKKGEWLRLQPGEVKETALSAEVVTGEFIP
jgi:galactose mutarotase-like enzyme